MSLKKSNIIVIVCIGIALLMQIGLYAQNRQGYNIDPELSMLDNFTPPMNKSFCALARGFMELLPKGMDKDSVSFKKVNADGIKLHIISPKSLQGKQSKCIFYIHGGGFVFKASPNHYKMEQAYALGADCRVIGIDYSLTPKHKYPTQVNECLSALDYIISNAEELNVHDSDIIIAGDSAGALLALDAYLNFKDKHRISALMLIYPVVDNRQESESMHKFTDTPCWNANLNTKMWEWYLGGQEYISPLERIDEFNGLKRVFIEVEEFDCLHDEGIELYNKLKKKVLYIYLLDNKGTFHGYDINSKANITTQSIQKRVEFLK